MTADEGNPYTSSPGSVAGGKFRKKPYRRSHASTPYDRPPSSVRNLSGLLPTFVGGEKSGNGGWLRRIVNPAQRIISASAHKLLGSVFQKRITRPPPPPPPPTPPSQSHEFVLGGQENQQEAFNISSREHQAAVHDIQKATSANDEGSFVTLETVLKRRTFSQSEIDRLTALLHARALDSSVANEVEKPEVFPSGFPDLGEGSSIIVQKADGNENYLPTTHAVLNGDVMSPAELAKSYMGTRPSKVAPSQQTSKLPVASLVPTSSNQRVVHDNGYTTPRSRGRSAIYSMARTPYARVHQNTSLKILESMSKRGDVQLVAPQESELERIPGSSALKRRSSIFENDIGSVGPVRRIRHKPNLLYQKNNSLLSSTSAASHLVSLPSTESNNKFSEQSVSNEGITVPSKNMSPSKSTEIASKILEQLDKIVSPPKEKYSVVMLASLRDKASLKLSPSDLHVKALKSLKLRDSSKFVEIAGGSSKLDNSVSTSHQDSGASALQDIDKVEQGGLLRTCFGFDQLPPASSQSEKTIANGHTMLNHKVGDLEETNHLTMPSAPKRQTFRMSAREDYYDLDDDDQQNEAVLTKFVEEEQMLNSTKMKPALAAEADREDESKPVSHCLKNGKTGGSPFTADFREKTVTFSFPGMPSAEKNVKPNQVASCKPVSETSNSEKELRVASSAFSFDMKASSANVEKPVTSVFAFASNGPVTKDAEKFDGSLSKSSSRCFSTISEGPVASVTKATELNKVDEKKDPSPGVLETSATPLNVTAPLAAGLFKFGVPSDPAAAASQPSLSSAAESNPPPLERPLGNLPLVASSATQGSNDKSSFLQSSSNFAVQAPIFKFGSTTTLETTAVALVEAQTKVVSGSEKALQNPFSASSTSPMSSIFGFSSPALISASSDKVGSVSFGVSNGFSQVQASTSSSGLSSSTQTAPQFGSSAPSFSFGLAGNNTTSSGSFMFSSPSAFKFSSGTSSDENALPSLESTVPSSNGSTATGLFGSLLTTSAPAFAPPTSSSSSPSTGFSFGAMSSSASLISFGENISSMSSSKSIFGSSGASTSSNGPSNFTLNGSSPASSVSPIFGAAAPTSAPAPTFTFGASTVGSTCQPALGNSSPVPFGQTSAGKNNDQMNAEDIMAEDMMPVATSSGSLFGQQPAPPPSSNFVFGSGASSPLQFGGQPSFAAPTNPSPFAASGSLGFNSSGGGSFSLGTGGGDKSGRKIIRVKRRK